MGVPLEGLEASPPPGRQRKRQEPVPSGTTQEKGAYNFKQPFG